MLLSTPPQKICCQRVTLPYGSYDCTLNESLSNRSWHGSFGIGTSRSRLWWCWGVKHRFPQCCFCWKRLMMFVFQKTSYLAGIWQATSFDMVPPFFEGNPAGEPAVQTDLQLFQGSLKAPTWQRVMLGTSGSIGTQSRKWWVVSQKILTHDGSMGLVYLPTFGFIFYDRYVGKYPIIHGSYGL